jgi:hypothetical protein
MAKQEWFDTDFYTVEKSDQGNVRIKPYKAFKNGRLVDIPYRFRSTGKRSKSVYIHEGGWGRWVSVDDININK